MLEVETLILSRFLLLLEILLDLSLDVDHKCDGFPKFCWKKALNLSQVGEIILLYLN